jgi:putative ABC transport system substrate-binding protein
MWPLPARAQQPDRMRRIGVLMNTSENDAVGQRHLTAFKQGLEGLGWVDSRNARVAAGKKPL